MKIIKLIFIFCVASCVYSNNQAIATEHQSDKCYLPKDLIQVEQDGINIITKNGPVKVKMLRTNKQGVFIYWSDIIAPVEKRGWCDIEDGYACAGCGAAHPTTWDRDICEAVTNPAHPNWWSSGR